MGNWGGVSVVLISVTKTFCLPEKKSELHKFHKFQNPLSPKQSIMLFMSRVNKKIRF